MNSTDIRPDYIAAYTNVIAAVSDVTAYVTPALHQQIEAMEATMTAAQIETNRERARRAF
jgi:hypothetical protein